MSLADTLLELAPAIAHEVEILIHYIAVSDSPEAAVTAAQKAVLADLGDRAAEELARKALAQGMKR